MTQVGSEVTAGENSSGHGGDQGLAIWRLPTFASIKDNAGLDHHLLDNILFIALEG
jgi:hypothetical protein